jgi:hypothetical protein
MYKKIFYILKPFIPRSIQLYIRRKIILVKLKKYKDIWPVLKGSEKKPENWSGWPENKKFALVLTHDVEHQHGYNRVLELMQIEKDLGFVSSFNFIPERDYQVEKSLLDTLRENGFEYGVHGLTHNGKLFSSENEFLKRAKKINDYLKDWGAVGFRAPSMHHNLDWIGALDIEYDLSTFDTDPFEPQPDGVATIFPFWVKNPRHKSGGYFELPYTLSQDFTPFILLKEKSPRIWQDKTDWIVKNSGMVLVNVHPDYINFDNVFSNEEYPISIYSSFLEFLQDKYHEQFWNALPKDVALYFKNIKQINIETQK